jgi:hypothetical protein
MEISRTVTDPATIHRVKFRWIMRWDSDQRRLRIARLLWNRGVWGMKDADGRCVPYSFALTLAIRPAWFSFGSEHGQVRITIAGIAINYHSSAGGQLT